MHDGTGSYSFTPASVLVERRKKAQEDEEWKQYFNGRTPELITWDEWDDLSLWWSTNKTYYIIPTVRMIDSADLRQLGDWKMPFRIIFQKLDFRDLLRMLRISKDFQSLVKLEIDRRRFEMGKSGFYSDESNWYLGTRCQSEDFSRHLKICNLWEEILTHGEHGKCRKCIKNARESKKKQLPETQAWWFKGF